MSTFDQISGILPKREARDAMYDLRDGQWEKIKVSLPGKKSDPERTGGDNRRFISAVMWIARDGTALEGFSS